MENPAEETVRDLQEGLSERASEAREGLLTRIALTTALIAALAAVTGYLAGERADEALVDQIHASDQWSYYQAKSIKGGGPKRQDRDSLRTERNNVLPGRYR